MAEGSHTLSLNLVHNVQLLIATLSTVLVECIL